ncbi:MAG: YcxB family protein [Thalassotalea sp.]
MSYSSSFMLDKAHFIECYEQTAKVKKGLSPYKKSIALILLSIFAAYFAAQYPTLSLFILGLGVVEALSVYFAKTWWVWRQLLSRSANTKVEITIDEKGFVTRSVQMNLELSWPEISQLTETSSGLILHHQQGRSYLSLSCLPAEAITFIKQKVKLS